MRLHHFLVFIFFVIAGMVVYQSRHAFTGGDSSTTGTGSGSSQNTGSNGDYDSGEDSGSGPHKGGFLGGFLKSLNGHGSLAKTVQDARQGNVNSHSNYSSDSNRSDNYGSSKGFSGGGIGNVGTLKEMGTGVNKGYAGKNTNNYKFESTHGHGHENVPSGPPDDFVLLQAADKGDETTVAQKLDAHVKIDSRDSQHRTPLMFSSSKGYDDISARLIAAGASPMAEDQSGHNAFDYAAGSGRVDSVKFLLAHSHSEDSNHYVDYANLIQVVSTGKVEQLPASLPSEEINRVSPQGQSPLHIAAGNGSVAMAEALIQRGAKVDVANDGGQTPLHWAAWDNQAPIIEMLVSKGANLNKVDLGGNSALILAAQNNSKDAVKALVAHGADKYIANQAGKTAGIIAEDKGYKDLAEMLK